MPVSIKLKASSIRKRYDLFNHFMLIFFKQKKKSNKSMSRAQKEKEPK